VEDRVQLVFDLALVEVAAQGRVEQRARVADRDALAGAVGPPVQPVLTSQMLALCFFIFSASSSAYLPGCQTGRGAEARAEGRLGSVTPTSVPATFAV
jgi:hypothetical protein